MAKPWIGKDYGSPDNMLGGWRLMLLGESHYSKDHQVGDEIPEMTRDVVAWHIRTAAKGGFRFFNRIEKLVCRSLKTGPASSAAFWDSVIFSNYIPVLAASRPREKLDGALWSKRAADEFRDIVNTQKVDAVLACGTTVYRNKPHDQIIPDAYQVGDRLHTVHIIERNDGQLAVAGHIRHPTGSFGWSYDRSFPVLDVLRGGARRIPLPEGMA